MTFVYYKLQLLLQLSLLVYTVLTSVLVMACGRSFARYSFRKHP